MGIDTLLARSLTGHSSERVFQRYIEGKRLAAAQKAYYQAIGEEPQASVVPLSRTRTTKADSVGSVVTPVDKETARAIARQAKEEMKQMLAQLAEKENAVKWAEAIAQWMQQHLRNKAVSLLKLQKALEMPLVEVWLGLLLSNQQYKWEQRGDFYRDAEEIWISV